MKTTKEDVKEFFGKTNLQGVLSSVIEDKGLEMLKTYFDMVAFIESNDALEELVMGYFDLETFKSARHYLGLTNERLDIWAQGVVMGILFREWVEEKQLVEKLKEIYKK